MDLLKEIKSHGENGYEIVSDFINSLGENSRKHIESELRQNQSNHYTKDIYNKYNPNFPAWVFLELLPFGAILDFYHFCADRFQSKQMKNRFYILIRCKNVRNACAHNDCYLNDLHIGTAKYITKFSVNQRLSKIPSLSRNARINRMKNERIQELIYVLYIHNDIVTSKGVHNKAAIKLHSFEERMMKHKDYYKGNNLISASFEFLKLAIDNWFAIS